MPYISMTNLELPDDIVTIWRYIDLWKFESIVKTLGLYFVRSDRFTDSWDSVLPPKWLAKMQSNMCDRPDGGTYTEAEWYEQREIPTNPIQCWNCDDNESAEMWRQYTSGSEALVIRSTIGRFKQCFASTASDVRIGLVKYGYHDELDDPKFAVGYWGDKTPMILNPWYVPRYFKKQEFAYEKEVRATIHVGREHQPIDRGYNLVIGKYGVRTLIESIRLIPNATVDLRERVQSLLSEYGLGDIAVELSILSIPKSG
jgi:hypothetical protein